jgi:Tfp pilus assembly protein PilZ
MINSDSKDFQDPTVTHRLFALITGMSDDERHTLLELLEKGLLKGRCRRGYRRKQMHLPIAYSDGKEAYRNFSKDISLGGVFILTRGPFKVGEEIRIIFKTDEKANFLKIFGEIVRVTPEGIGARFTGMNNDQKSALRSLASTV